MDESGGSSVTSRTEPYLNMLFQGITKKKKKVRERKNKSNELRNSWFTEMSSLQTEKG